MPKHLEGVADGYEGGLGLGTLRAAIGVAVLLGSTAGRIPHVSRLKGYAKPNRRKRLKHTLGAGHAGAAGIGLHRHAQRPAGRLEHRLEDVVGVAAMVHQRVQVHRRGV